MQYHNALCNEIRDFSVKGAGEGDNKGEIKTLFIGGGTPSLYPLGPLRELFDILHKNFCLRNLKEATIEVNPGDVTTEHLETWRSLGLNRLSIGVQILDEDILKSVNRHQKNSAVIELLQKAPNYFDNISVDLILGLPGTTDKIWFDTLKFVTSHNIKHLSVYTLTIYEKTPLYFKICPKSPLYNKKISLPDEDWLVDTYEKTIKMLEERGFFQYETSNFSKQNYESIHNKAYWDRRPYKGFGLSAASFDGKNRLVNSGNLLKYLDYWLRSKGPTPVLEEELSSEDVLLEELMLGLRQKKGLDLRRMLYSLEREFPKFKEKIADLKEKGLVEEKDGFVFLSTRGMFLENEIVLNLL